jgi:peroxiredoxin Q/BCP
MGLSKGDIIPDFVLPDQDGNPYDIKNVKGKKNLVIYFYPKDETAGCTAEACSFRDNYEAFTDLGAEVIGISSDGIESHGKFRSRHQLPFVLLSDSEKSVRKRFGVPTNFLGLVPGRVTYIVDREGVIQHQFNSQTKVEQHVDEAIKVLQLMNS